MPFRRGVLPGSLRRRPPDVDAEPFQVVRELPAELAALVNGDRFRRPCPAQPNAFESIPHDSGMLAGNWPTDLEPGGMVHNVEIGPAVAFVVGDREEVDPEAVAEVSCSG